MEPRYTNCNECKDVVRRDEVDASGICELCLDQHAVDHAAWVQGNG